MNSVGDLRVTHAASPPLAKKQLVRYLRNPAHLRARTYFTYASPGRVSRVAAAISNRPSVSVTLCVVYRVIELLPQWRDDNQSTRTQSESKIRAHVDTKNFAIAVIGM